MFLNMKFSKLSENEEIQDQVLGRRVSSFVFIMNSKLVKEAYKEKLELSEKKKQEIHLKAQINEYVNSVLRKQGVVITNDERISMAFLNLSQNSFKQ